MSTLEANFACRGLVLAGCLLAASASAGPVLHASPDLNTDGKIDQHDMAAFKRAFASGDLAGDFNADGRVDFADVALFSVALDHDVRRSRQLAGGDAPRVYVLPEASGPVQTGDEVVLEVWFDGVANPILGGGWTMAFDPARLAVSNFEYVLVDLAGQSCDEPTSTCITLDPPIIDHANGLVQAGAGDFNGIGLLGATTQVALVTVQVLQDADSFVEMAEGGLGGTFVCIGDFATCPGLTLGNATLSLSGQPFPVVSVDPPAIDFGTVSTDDIAQASFTLSNIGTGELNLGTLAGVDPLTGEFAIDTDSCSNQTIPVESACDVTISFSPDDNGMRTDTFDIPSNALLSPSISYPLSGTGVVLAPIIEVASTLDFPATEAGDEVTLGVNVFNAGNGPLILETVGEQDPLDAPFILSSACDNASIEPNETCAIAVTFAPDTEGVFTDSFDIPSNDDTNPTATVTVTGEALPQPGAIIVTPTDVNFRLARPGQLRAATVTVLNLGPGDETVAPIAQTDGLAPPFTISADNCSGLTLSAGEDCQIELAFAPTEAGDFTDQFDVPLDESGLPVRLVDVRGVAENLGIRFPHAIPIVAICKNAETGQRVTTVDVDGQIDCEAAGLLAESGEIVNVFASTIAISNTVLAFSQGVDVSAMLVVCTNRNSGQQVTFTPGRSSFSCANNGLEIIQGDPVFVTIRAPAQ